jgi:hemerythrin
MIVWNDSFNIGVQQFDEQNQHLVGLLNQAYANFISGAPSENVESILNEFVVYSTNHIEAEESWMHEQSYPMLAALRDEHDRFLDTIVDMLKCSQFERRYLLMEVLTFVNVWLTSHIRRSVADYNRYNAELST